MGHSQPLDDSAHAAWSSRMRAEALHALVCSPRPRNASSRNLFFRSHPDRLAGMLLENVTIQPEVPPMFRRVFLLLLPFALLVPKSLPAGDSDGYRPMFNGKDLSGWVNVNCHPKTFFVRDNMIVTTGFPTGYLRTDKQYENFIAEFDW